MTAIPKIDFQKYGLQVSDPDSVSRDDLQDLGNQICKALEEIGFFYLKNHGLPDENVSQWVIRVINFRKIYLNKIIDLEPSTMIIIACSLPN